MKTPISFLFTLLEMGSHCLLLIQQFGAEAICYIQPASKTRCELTVSLSSNIEELVGEVMG